MLLSRRLKAVFIKGRKVAGTSVEIALSLLASPEDIVTPIAPGDELERLRLGGRPQNYSADPAVERDYLRSITVSERGAIPHPKAWRPYYNHMPLRELLLQNPEVSDYLIFCVERSPYSKLISWRTGM